MSVSLGDGQMIGWVKARRMGEVVVGLGSCGGEVWRQVQLAG